MNRKMLEGKREERDLYEKERERYYKRNGWGIEAREINERDDRNIDRDILERERETQKQDSRIQQQDKRR